MKKESKNEGNDMAGAFFIVRKKDAVLPGYH